MKKILIVDDDADLTKNYETVLRAKGYEVTVSHSATEGLKKALQVRPHLIILDVSMETDTAGFEFAFQIRSSRDGSRYREIREVPIVLLTAITQVTNSRFSLNDKESFLPNIEEIITKPAKMDELLAKIQKHV